MKTIGRRFMLRGLGGVGIALPALEIMTSTGSARAGGETAMPKRFLVSYAGMSYGKPSVDRVVPDVAGPDYTMTRGLQPIGDGSAIEGHSPVEAFNVREHVNVVTNLRIPHNLDVTGPTPAGGIGPEFHGLLPGLIQLTGYRRHAVGEAVQGSSADRIVAKLHPQMPVLTYRVQPVSYLGFQGPRNPFLSWEMPEGATEAEPIPPIASPRTAYDTMLSEWVPPDPVEAAKAKAILERRLSALDLVRDSRHALLATVGTADKVRLEQHFEEIFELESRIEALGEPQTLLCDEGFAALEDPGEDSAEIAYNNRDEEARARVLTDLVRLAFVCDSRRVASLMYSYLSQAQIGVSALPGWSWPTDNANSVNLHGLTHASNAPEATADGVAWFVRHFARLARLLADSPEPDGSSVLDNTVMLLLFEGGRGWSPFEGRDSVHSTERMMILTAGGTNLGLVTGQHLVTDQVHPSRVILSAMQAAGADVDTLGEVSGAYPGLFA